MSQEQDLQSIVEIIESMTDVDAMIGLQIHRFFFNQMTANGSIDKAQKAYSDFERALAISADHEQIQKLRGEVLAQLRRGAFAN